MPPRAAHGPSSAERCAERQHPPSQSHRAVARVVLQRVARFMRGDRRAGDARLTVDALREADGLSAWIVMIGQLARLDRDLTLVQIVRVQHMTSDDGAGQIQRISDFAPSSIGGSQPYLHQQGKDEADSDDQVEWIDHNAPFHSPFRDSRLPFGYSKPIIGS